MRDAVVESPVGDVRTDVDRMTAALMEMAGSYGWGTPVSRAVVSATEHARIVVLGPDSSMAQ